MNTEWWLCIQDLGREEALGLNISPTKIDFASMSLRNHTGQTKQNQPINIERDLKSGSQNTTTFILPLKRLSQQLLQL